MWTLPMITIFAENMYNRSTYNCRPIVEIQTLGSFILYTLVDDVCLVWVNVLQIDRASFASEYLPYRIINVTVFIWQSICSQLIHKFRMWTLSMITIFAENMYNRSTYNCRPIVEIQPLRSSILYTLVDDACLVWVNVLQVDEPHLHHNIFYIV